MLAAFQSTQHTQSTSAGCLRSTVAVSQQLLGEGCQEEKASPAHTCASLGCGFGLTVWDPCFGLEASCVFSGNRVSSLEDAAPPTREPATVLLNVSAGFCSIGGGGHHEEGPLSSQLFGRERAAINVDAHRMEVTKKSPYPSRKGGVFFGADRMLRV